MICSLLFLQHTELFATIRAMGKTKELYYESAYIKEFDAVVTECIETEDGKFEIILDQTAFFPEEGGQTSDIGVLCFGENGKSQVSYVSITSGIIKHLADTEIKAGERVHGIIDWNHRFSNMQQHTGEHIFSGIVSSRFGYDNVGFHLSDSEVTMDYSGSLSPEDIREIELEVNRAIWADIEVICQFPSREELDTIQYRSKKELSGDVRIVTIPGYDVCACCAPHVLRTGEIGLCRVVSLKNYKGGVRVSILCGARAYKHVSDRLDIVDGLADIFTTSSDNIISSVKKLSSENYEIKGKLLEITGKLIDYEISQIAPDKENVFLLKEDIDASSMRKIVNTLTKRHRGYCGVFLKDADKASYRYVISGGEGKKDLGALNDELKLKFAAKGGGNDEMIQGSIVSCEDKKLLEFLENL